MKIAIMYGGTSTEREASTENAEYVETALKELGHETVMIPYDKNLFNLLSRYAPDAAFICVQGKGHGDGVVQGILDFMNIPYTGSRALGAAVINDKILCKELFQAAGVRTPPSPIRRGPAAPPGHALSRADFLAGRLEPSGLEYPFVAKPPTQGLSIGIELFHTPRDLWKLETTFQYDDPILLERFIPGHNATVGILEHAGGRRTLFPPVGHPVNEEENTVLLRAGAPGPWVVRDYPEPLAGEITALAEKVFTLTRAAGYARVDFRISSEDRLPYVLEINAVPGLKPSSPFVRGASQAGIDYHTIIRTIITAALPP
ncbi:MAG: ATP-grasp domain-containing protein, partial [Spirochaetaceae bacterium]|nr:ATP-grasp domain-containing protein [Spirochaetaceae bacterium]